MRDEKGDYKLELFVVTEFMPSETMKWRIRFCRTIPTLALELFVHALVVQHTAHRRPMCRPVIRAPGRNPPRQPVS
jgi:hypothetical protein